ncbi:hypothetical protein [Caulobacter hibisci]|uniref:Uncharacterized protein n=1 Tax=Caulobacter hibisci TaxID=2035993 RepID=A0ABS0SXF6_9CAUL|nr:hypothetical protein [Caulobacter hibisci]MBI1684278.1 hypothetical protein [Caulobacter hibisci]
MAFDIDHVRTSTAVDAGDAFGPPIGDWIIWADHGLSAIAAFRRRDEAQAYLGQLRRQARTIGGLLAHNRSRARAAEDALRRRLGRKPHPRDDAWF